MSFTGLSRGLHRCTVENWPRLFLVIVAMLQLRGYKLVAWDGTWPKGVRGAPWDVPTTCVFLPASAPSPCPRSVRSEGPTREPRCIAFILSTHELAMFHDHQAAGYLLDLPLPTCDEIPDELLVYTSDYRHNRYHVVTCCARNSAPSMLAVSCRI